jgi:tRNA(Ile)-lysidine synthase
MSFSAASLRAVLELHAPAGATGLVVALSGGADSAGLLAAAASWGEPFRAMALRAVHVDHGLQPAAASFRDACVALCRTLEVRLTVIRVAVDVPPGGSLEAAARDARYARLAWELKPGECLLTAHHALDQAETLLLQALRGAGLKGLSAMPFCRPLGRGWHLRPVLEVPQAELLAFGARAGSGGVVDPMNADLRFDRSYLRRQVWPRIETRWPGAGIALSRVAHHAAQAQGLLDRAASGAVGRLRDGEALSVPGLRALAPQERINALRFWLCDAGVEPPSTVRLIEALRQILDAKADHQPVIAWGAHALRRYRQRIFLTPHTVPRLDGSRQWSVVAGPPLDLGADLGRLCWIPAEGGLDIERLSGRLIVRRRAGGETLKPALHARTQSVQHLCQCHGVLPWLRDALPLVFADDALIAIGDLWVDARFCTGSGAPGLAIAWVEGPIIV